MTKIALSANIENGFSESSQYIVTPNAKSVAATIVNGFQSGVHSFTIVGTYGTGKSSFLIALKEDLTDKRSGKYFIQNPKVLSSRKDFQVLDIIGDYDEMSSLLLRKLNVEDKTADAIDVLRNYYNHQKSLGKFLVILVDEFGKVLEHAAKKNPEKEMYFLQKLAEYVNVPTRDIILITTLHQNFSAYARKLNEAQRKEWNKVKGRFKEIVFVEPVEQILLLASKRFSLSSKDKTIPAGFRKIYQLAIDMNFISQDMSYDSFVELYPLDPFSSFCLTEALQRYGQNERSLFSFLNAKGNNTLSGFKPSESKTYNLQQVYDYVVYNFYSYLKDANADSMSWGAMRVAIERVEGQKWETPQAMMDAIKIVKAIGVLNMFGKAGFSLTREQLSIYAQNAMEVKEAYSIINALEHFKIIRYAEFKHRIVLFEGTDINIENEVLKAGMVVSRPVAYIGELKEFFNRSVAPVKASYYHRGTPRFFAYDILDEGEDRVPTGDIDGYIELIFPSKENYKEELKKLSANCDHAVIFAYFNNTKEIVDHLYNLNKYEYILQHVLADQFDLVAIKEVKDLHDFETVQLNKAIYNSLYSYTDNVTWIYKGEEKKVSSQRDFNHLLSNVCDEVYCLTPIMNNELFNKNKLSSSISGAKSKYLQALVNNSEKVDFGFDSKKFPPEKTIYYSLLKNTGLHLDGRFTSCPSNADIKTLWEASEAFLQSTSNKPRKISELVKKLSSQPYKLKAGFLDFWIPTYLFIKRQDYSLYGANGAYIPELNMEFFELLQKHPGEYLVKAFDVSGVKMEFFNQYRKFVDLEAVGGIKSDQLIDTIRPFFFFYNRRLNDYAKHTQKFDHEETRKFRDILARAKDPEKTFLEDLPEALGYDKNKQNSEEFAKQYGYIINRAVRELRSCYSKLIDRIEQQLVEQLGLSSYDYEEYIKEIRQRLSSVKTFLLTDRLKEFYNHAMAEFDKRTEWYQSICYSALDQPLERLRDNQEEKLINELIELFRECEKYAEISKVQVNSGEQVFSFDMVTSGGDVIKPQTYKLTEKDKKVSDELGTKIEELLKGKDDVAVVTLLRLLNKKCNE
ncbi:hypothetical protein [Prevotella sp. AGR2160]|uniref:hypothetical protein n=1 Tax=Prevotella sp. AGR2160 TaxID=1280674 RepID=UPI0003F52D69|nr:hypothetical protein [Prevotella sp. AGR2160]